MVGSYLCTEDQQLNCCKNQKDTNSSELYGVYWYYSLYTQCIRQQMYNLDIVKDIIDIQLELGRHRSNWLPDRCSQVVSDLMAKIPNQYIKCSFCYLKCSYYKLVECMKDTMHVFHRLLCWQGKHKMMPKFVEGSMSRRHHKMSHLNNLHRFYCIPMNSH